MAGFRAGLQTTTDLLPFYKILLPTVTVYGLIGINTTFGHPDNNLHPPHYRQW